MGLLPTLLTWERKIEKSQAQQRSISHKIFIILIKLLEALNNPELNENLDKSLEKIISGKIQVLKKADKRQLKMLESLKKDS